MAIRFIDTNYFKSPFVRGLSGPMKSLYTFIICDSSGAGIWAADFEVASLYIGHKVTESDFEKWFINTSKAINLNNGRYFFPDFILHQYPNGLQDKNPAHKNIISELIKYQLIEKDTEGAFKLLQRPSKGSQVIVIDTVIVNETATDKVKVKGTSQKIPELFEVIEYFKIKGSTEEQANHYYDFYESNGWKVGKNPMKNWKAAVHNWLRNKFENGNTTRNKSRPRPLAGEYTKQVKSGEWSKSKPIELIPGVPFSNGFKAE